MGRSKEKGGVVVQLDKVYKVGGRGKRVRVNWLERH